MYTPAELALLRAMDPNTLAGVDTSVGNLKTPTNAVSSISSSPYAGVRYVASSHEVIVTQAGAVLDGYNFGSNTVYVCANNVTIRNSTFSAGAGEVYSVQQGAGVSGTVVQNDTFNGASAANPLPLASFFLSTGTSINVLSSKFLNAPGDAIDTQGGVISGNYFSGGGFSSVGTHPDAIWVTNSQSPTLISNNFIDWTWANDASNLSNGQNNDAVRVTAELGPVSNVTVANNVLLGGVYTIDAGNALKAANGSAVTASSYSNITITGNYIGFGAYGDFMYGPQYGVTASNNAIAGFNNPAYSTNAWSAYQSSISTNNRIVASSAAVSIQGPSTGSTTLYGNGFSGHLFGTANETVFVGGYSAQYLFGGAGPDVFKYLAFSDSPNLVGTTDAISNFNPLKDVIDLSAIDANPATAGMQPFTFIGSGNFSDAGAQVRVVQNASANTTYVQATMAGSSYPTLNIRLTGLVNLTAANFALTSAQANILQGDTTLYSSGKVTGTAAFLADGTENLFGAPASALAAGLQLASASAGANNSGSLSLYANNLSLSSGTSSLKVQSGTNTFSIAAHANETIQATGHIGEIFAYTTGFGSSDVVGFAASGANDQIQLQASMFPGLTSGQSATDWAHLISSHAAVQSGPDVVITDMSGDALRLSGITLATLTANAASAFKFL